MYPKIAPIIVIKPKPKKQFPTPIASLIWGYAEFDKKSVIHTQEILNAMHVDEI